MILRGAIIQSPSESRIPDRTVSERRISIPLYHRLCLSTRILQLTTVLMSHFQPISSVRWTPEWAPNNTRVFLVARSYMKSSYSYLLDITRKPSIEAGIRRNAISYPTWNELWTHAIQPYPCSAAILSAILEFVIRFVSNFYNWCSVSLRTSQWKKTKSLY